MSVADQQLVYEVSLEVSPDILAEYDAWLDDHVAEMLGIPGFLTAEISRIDPPEDNNDWAGRSVRYVVTSQDMLDRYLADHAPRMRELGKERFGEQFRASRRILRGRKKLSATAPTAATPDCPNCGTPLHGQYCWQCGQRSRVRLITLWELMREAVGDLFELDSRLWRSILPLLFRPGLLTNDYLEGRRARYMPPFRMYLVLSIIFFLVWSLNAGEFRVTPDPDAVTASAAVNQKLNELEQLQQQDPDPARQEKINQLKKVIERMKLADVTAPPGDDNLQIKLDGIGTIAGNGEVDAISGASPFAENADEQSDIPVQAGATRSVEPQTAAANPDKEKKNKGWNCEKIEFDMGWDFLNQRLGKDRIVAACKKMEKDQGASFGKAMLDNLPAMMFIFLPLLALALKVLYLGSGRFYVEHLLFTVHYHAFFFLIVTLTILVNLVQEPLHLPDWLSGIFTAVVVLYIQPVYLYKALRRVYQQGHIATFIRWVLLSVAYVFAMMTTMVVGVLYTALTL